MRVSGLLVTGDPGGDEVGGAAGGRAGVGRGTDSELGGAPPDPPLPDPGPMVDGGAGPRVLPKEATGLLQ